MNLIKNKVRAALSIAILCATITAFVGCGGASSGSGSAKSPADIKPAITADGKKVAVKESAIEVFTQALAAVKTDPAQAKSLFQKATKEDPNFAEAYYNIGLLEEKAGKLDDALDAYQRARSIRPTLSEPVVNIAMILLKQGKDAEAEKLLLELVDEKTGLDPFNIDANLNLGMIYRQRGADILEKASGGVEKEFSMSGTENTKSIQNQDALSEFGKAVTFIRRALAGDSNNIYCYENLSAIYYMMNNLEVATLVAEQAQQKYIERNNQLDDDLAAGRITQEVHDEKIIQTVDMAAVYNTTGLIWLAKGEVSIANMWFKRAVEANPESIDAMLNVAGIAVNVQDFPTANDMYDRVLALQPDNLEAKLSKAVAVRGLNNLDEAEKIYRDIIAKNPDYVAAKFNLAVLYQEYYQKLDEAKAMFEEFQTLPVAQQTMPGRVKEAKTRVEQIVALWEAQKKAEEEYARMQQVMAEMEKMEKEQEAAAAAAAAAEQAAPEAEPAPAQ